MRWEHLIVDFDRKQLKTLERAGWELVQILDGARPWQMVLKRPAQESTVDELKSMNTPCTCTEAKGVLGSFNKSGHEVRSGGGTISEQAVCLWCGRAWRREWRWAERECGDSSVESRIVEIR